MNLHTNMKNRQFTNRGVKDHVPSPAFFAPPAPGENGSRHATLLVFKGQGTRNRNPIRSRACKSPHESGSARPPFPCACDGTR